jgi:CRP/FNR family transcriptional regulator, cyclic AMP receptor protein
MNRPWLKNYPVDAPAEIHPKEYNSLTIDEPILTPEEREAINSGRWFYSLSPSLRHDIFRHATVRRFESGELMAKQGASAAHWWACARGSVRVSSMRATGKLITLSFVQPGVWFGDVALFDGGTCTHDAYAHGATTILSVSKESLDGILNLHVELYDALLRLQARRTRHLFGMVQDLSMLPLRSRLAKQLAQLARAYGVASDSDSEVRIALKLPQEELARMLGASRQRVNQELKALERENVIRIEAKGHALVVLDAQALVKIGQTEE